MESGSRALAPPWRVGLVGLGIVAALAAGPTLLRPMEANPSGLINTVKNNPGMAQQMCQQFNAINSGGHSVYSSTGLQQVASSQGIATGDAEILITYVVGLYCPGVN